MATYDKLIDLERLQTFKDGCDSEYQQTLVSGTNIKTVNSQSLLGSGNIAISSDITTWYGTCSTAGSERIKEVSCDGFTLKKGAILLVYFDTQNTYTGDNSTALNVNSTGSKAITMGQAAKSKNLVWSARTHVLFVYNGSEWVYLVSSAGGSYNLVEGAGVYYGSCSTPAYDADKLSGGPQWSERANGLVVVSMSNGNTVTDRKLTLSVNSMGSKDIYVKGTATSSTNTLLWNAGDILFFMWSISHWKYLGGSTAYGYTLPTASTSTLGGVKVDGSTITIDGNGVISGSSSVSPYTSNPAMDGTASAGSSNDYARGDHVHPTDTSRVAASVTDDGETTAITNAGFQLYEQYSSNEGRILHTVRLNESGVSLQATNYQSGSNAASIDIFPTGVSIPKLYAPTTDTMPTTKKYVDDGLAAKQAALVSGTNIKTVNSTSLLGSGNVAVQPTLVSGTNIKTVNNESLLGSGNVSISFDETSTEIPLDTSPMSSEAAEYFAECGAENVSLGLDALHSLAETKQAILVSGTNIKTVGSQSLLGSGNLTVSDIGAAPTSHTHQYAGSPAVGGNANQANAILYGAVDSTSTSTVFTATVAGLTQLVDGTTIMLRNGVVTSASGFTLEVNDLGALPVYNNMATGNSITPTAPARDTTIFNINYTMIFTYVASDIVEGGCWICWRGYDGNTNTIGYQLRTNSSTLKASDTGYRYRLWFTSADRTKWVPANTSTSTSATSAKTMNTRPIDPFGPIVYNSTNGTVTANADVPKTTIWTVYTLDARYSYMKSGFSLTYPAPVFVKCTPQSNGSAVMSELVQAFPNSNDGKIYIFLGIAYSASSMELRPEHPVYYHDGTAVRLWTGAAASSVSPATATPSMDGTAAVGSSAKYAREDHVHPTDTSRQATLVSGTNIKTINGDSILGSGDLTVSGGSRMTWFGTCSTAASTGAKVVDCSGFTLEAGAVVYVWMSQGNTYGDGTITLNVNSTGAKFVKHSSGNLVSDMYPLIATTDSTLGFIYDGTYWVLISDLALGYKMYGGTLPANRIRSYSLPKASTTAVGGVKVGSGLAIAADGTLSLDVASASGVSF